LVQVLQPLQQQALQQLQVQQLRLQVRVWPGQLVQQELQQ
jgi:hypothetical protein